MSTLEEMQQKWDEEEKYYKDHPVEGFFHEAYLFLRYRLWRMVEDGWYEVKWGFQRMFRGFDDRWYWSYYSMNAEQTVKVLKWLQKHKHGSAFVNDPDGVVPIKEEETGEHESTGVNSNFHRRWDIALGLMIAGFEAFNKIEDVHILDENGKYDHAASEKERNRLEEKWKIGSKLFIANYRGLWD